ncbi:MAG TPA: hypothetical protein VNE67_17210 [Acetobacteraceae bacterium]|nr:hypothetical protein [Stellaceae bacterium]HVB69590.1 hypothetical protein [Acetobacteraceae bacterium]
MSAAVLAAPEFAMPRVPARFGRRAPRTHTVGEPFASAAEAWFWTCRALEARREGTGGGFGAPRPCTPDDLPRWLDALYRARRMTLEQARVLVRYGSADRPPDAAAAAEARHAELWAAAMRELAPLLWRAGVVR